MFAKIRVERQEDALFRNRRGPDFFVAGAGEADFHHGDGVVSHAADGPRMEWRQVLVQ